MSPPARKNGDYPDEYNSNSYVSRYKISIGHQTILLTKYESDDEISLYFGGFLKWCIHCDINKQNGQINPLGNIIKLRYDILCSLDDKFSRGTDTKALVNLLLQYIHNNYPDVTTLEFNDLSWRPCDDGSPVDLTVMTYLWTGKTWYEKNFDAYISNKNNSNINYYNYKNKLELAKSLPWEKIVKIIKNGAKLGYTDEELKQRYETAQTWKEFFNPIVDEKGISSFCIFVSPWLTKFTNEYFSNLMSLVFIMPIKERGVKYEISDYKNGGARYTRRVRKTKRKNMRKKGN
jgi:hypothetical protein